MCFLLTPKLDFGQTNLIINGNCEVYDTCPDDLGQITRLWTFGNLSEQSSCDYLNSCSSNNLVSIPSTLGFQLPHSGQGLIHFFPIITYNPLCYELNLPNGKSQFRENIVGEFVIPLQKGKYKFSVYVSCAFLPDCSSNNSDNRISINAFDLMILDSINSYQVGSPPEVDITKIYNLNTNQLNIEDTLNWLELECCITASGGEKFFSLGCFRDTLDINVNFFGCASDVYWRASYYLDDFSLIACDSCCLEDEVYDDHLVIASNPGTTASPTVFTSYLNGNTTATLEIFDSAGRLVATDHQQNLYNTFTLPPLAAAVYHYRFQTSNGVDETGKVVVE